MANGFSCSAGGAQLICCSGNRGDPTEDSAALGGDSGRSGAKGWLAVPSFRVSLEHVPEV